jgi:hypothetical protein
LQVEAKINQLLEDRGKNRVGAIFHALALKRASMRGTATVLAARGAASEDAE